ncbi:MAG TPA: MarR family transcriptional regulator [Patescibacteria group bacterium]|nr:MarR family transcriptional regulator [Patescibacteria group bacterium]
MKANDLPETKRPYRAGDRAASIDRVLDASDEMFRTVSNSHTAEFLEIGVTMPQAKTLHLVAAEGRIRMSVLATRLGVTLSTVSGLVERLVEAGCVARHDDPVDRRQVVVTLTPEGDALIERFRDLNRSQLRSLLVLLSDDDLDAVERAVTALTRAAERRSASQPLATSERESS